MAIHFSLGVNQAFDFLTLDYQQADFRFSGKMTTLAVEPQLSVSTNFQYASPVFPVFEAGVKGHLVYNVFSQSNFSYNVAGDNIAYDNKDNLDFKFSGLGPFATFGLNGKVSKIEVGGFAYAAIIGGPASLTENDQAMNTIISTMHNYGLDSSKVTDTFAQLEQIPFFLPELGGGVTVQSRHLGVNLIVVASPYPKVNGISFDSMGARIGLKATF